MNSSELQLLLADNDMDDCMLFNEALDEFSFEGKLITLHDGEQLMNYLKENIDDLPDMLFLDLNMPRKNGFECLAEIKMYKELQHLPIVIYSTSYELRMIQKLFNDGANIYIQKPNDFSTLRNVIQKAVVLLSVPVSEQQKIERLILHPK